ncbi:MAG: hypothetical protein HQ481_16350 [Alphaproteobacteria bacterium]|nr:hypothetical protein [Alphaproteobacteria bacterium]
MIKNAVFLSQHVLDSRRRAGMHFLARAYRDAGWRVTFVTVGLSPLARLGDDARLTDAPPEVRNRLVEIEPGLTQFVWMAPLHPRNAHRGWLNALTGPIFASYPAFVPAALRAVLAEADHVVVESAAGIMLVPMIRRDNPRARLIYRVSDDLRVLGAHPVVLAAERAALSRFSVISIPSPTLADRFPGLETVVHHPHGLDTAVFSEATASPYAPGERAVISVGTMLFDTAAALAVCRARPDLQVHFFGALADKPSADNAVHHGERPFAELVPYMQHAAVGAAFYRPAPGSAYLADTSNKMMQYAACRLPILAPDFVAGGRGHIFGYRPDDSGSIAQALDAALNADRSVLPFPTALSWDTVAAAIITDAEATGPR